MSKRKALKTVIDMLRQVKSQPAEERKEFVKLVRDTLASKEALEDARKILESRGLPVEEDDLQDYLGELQDE